MILSHKVGPSAVPICGSLEASACFGRLACIARIVNEFIHIRGMLALLEPSELPQFVELDEVITAKDTVGMLGACAAVLEDICKLLLEFFSPAVRRIVRVLSVRLRVIVDLEM